jgi:hypothetical protein
MKIWTLSFTSELPDTISLSFGPLTKMGRDSSMSKGRTKASKERHQTEITIKNVQDIEFPLNNPGISIAKMSDVSNKFSEKPILNTMGMGKSATKNCRRQRANKSEDQCRRI